MSVFDNFIAFISPQWAYRRECFKQAYTDLRSNYDAASHDKSGQNWRAYNDSAENIDRFERDTVKARARDLERNSDIMNSVISAFMRNVFGGGYKLQACTKDEELNSKIEKLWEEWCKKKNCDVTNTQSFNQIIRMAIRRKKVDGGILIVKVTTDKGFLPFQLQTFEVDELDKAAVIPKSSTNRVVDGIEYDQFNEPVGFFIKQYSIDGIQSVDPVYIPAKNVIFYFSKRRPSQLREISDMAQSIPRIRDVNEFMFAASVKERINACLSVFIKRGLPTTGVGRSTGGEQRVSYEGKTLSPGMIKELNAGDDIQVVNPSGQASDATQFTKQQLRLISAGQGLSYESTSRDMSQSTYSSARQGWIEDDLTYSEEKELLLSVVFDEIYESFIISLWLNGYLDGTKKTKNDSIKDFLANKSNYFAHKWVQQPKAWIDPYKESNANKVALQTGQKSFKTIAAENGRDWKSEIDDMAEVSDYGASKGLDMDSIIFGIKSDSGNSSEKEGEAIGQESNE